MEAYSRQPVTRTEWLSLLLQLLIPVWGIVLLFLTAFRRDSHPVLANFAKAMLVIQGIGAVLSGIGIYILTSGLR